MGGEKNYKLLLQLHPDIRHQAFAAVADLYAHHIQVTIPVSNGTYRSLEEQQKLYEKGRVTGAAGGQSYHNHGLAFDIWPKGEAINSVKSAEWNAMAEIVEKHGFTWGARPGATSIGSDKPHFQAVTTFKVRDQYRDAPRVLVDGLTYPLIEGGELAKLAHDQGINVNVPLAPSLPVSLIPSRLDHLSSLLPRISEFSEKTLLSVNHDIVAPPPKHLTPEQTQSRPTSRHKN